ncbi:MAG: hypothetical protein QOG42_426, partial [Solirubrobacteraceae bacterium]|nr:hypothetical protein [Solirubrobacteraceae bacterium]
GRNTHSYALGAAIARFFRGWLQRILHPGPLVEPRAMLHLRIVSPESSAERVVDALAGSAPAHARTTPPR